VQLEAARRAREPERLDAAGPPPAEAEARPLHDVPRREPPDDHLLDELLRLHGEHGAVGGGRHDPVAPGLEEQAALDLRRDHALRRVLRAEDEVRRRLEGHRHDRRGRGAGQLPGHLEDPAVAEVHAVEVPDRQHAGAGGRRQRFQALYAALIHGRPP
jgi:hypothetical protein